MSLTETIDVPIAARGDVLHRKRRIEACTFTTLVLDPNVVNNKIALTIFADHRDDMEAAKDRVQRAIDSQNAWELSGGRTVSSLFNRLAKLNYPDFRSGNIRGLRFRNLGPARTERVYYEDLFEGPYEDIDLTNSVLPLLDPLDALEQKMDAKVARGPTFEADRWRYKNLCAAALEYLSKQLESRPPPAKQWVLIVRELKTTPPVTHREVANMFPGEVIDVIFMRRGNADLTMRSSAYVVFTSSEDVSRALRDVPNCEIPKEFNYYNDNVKRRLLLLQCVVEEVPLSGSGLRGSGKRGRKNMRNAIAQHHRALEDARAAQDQAEEPQAVLPAAAEDAADAQAAIIRMADVEMPAQAEEQTSVKDAEIAVSQDDQPDEHALEDDFQMLDMENDVDDFVHTGLNRQEEEEYPDYDDDWADLDDDVPQPAPMRVHVDTAGFKWALHNTLLQRYAPDKLSQGKKPRHTEFEYVHITEKAFWRALDILWSKESFKTEMAAILQDNDKRFGRSNYSILLSGKRPTGLFNPYECRDPRVLTVPHWYKTLKYVQTAESLQRTMDYLASLRDFEWIALDTEGGGKSNRYAPCDPCETIQFATKKESFLVDVRLCHETVPAQLFIGFLHLLFTKGARFGFDFDQADRDKVVAAVSGNSNEALACRRLIRESRIYDVQRLVERAYEEVDPTDEACGPDRRPPGIPDYVRKKPRLAHYVHHVTKKLFNKAYTCSFWSERPFLEEQMTYAHMDTICIILMLQRCTKRQGGRQALEDWFGQEALAEIQRDNAD